MKEDKKIHPPPPKKKNGTCDKKPDVVLVQVPSGEVMLERASSETLRQPFCVRKANYKPHREAAPAEANVGDRCLRATNGDAPPNSPSAPLRRLGWSHYSPQLHV